MCKEGLMEPHRENDFWVKKRRRWEGGEKTLQARGNSKQEGRKDVRQKWTCWFQGRTKKPVWLEWSGVREARGGWDEMFRDRKGLVVACQPLWRFRVYWKKWEAIDRFCTSDMVGLYFSKSNLAAMLKIG